MSKGRRVRRSHLAWLRGENEIAWFSFAAKHTVSFSANVNKDRKRWDHRGPPAPPPRLLLEASPSWSPSLGLCGLSHWKRTVFSHVGSPNSAALGKISFLEPRDQRENDFSPALGRGLVSELRSQPAASLDAVSTVYCLVGRSEPDVTGAG